MNVLVVGFIDTDRACWLNLKLLIDKDFGVFRAEKSAISEVKKVQKFSTKGSVGQKN